MQVSIETTAALERRMRIQVPAQQVTDAINQRLRTVGRTVALKGFRPGKIPPNVVKQQFGPQVRKEVLDQLFQSTFAEAVAEQKLQPITNPHIEEFNAEADQDFSYCVTFEVYPEFELRGLEQLVLQRPQVEIVAVDIDTLLQKLRSQRATYLAVDRAAQLDDRVRIDFVGTIDGQTFEGGSGTQVNIILGAGRMLPEFESGLMDVRPGDNKDIALTFPTEYATHDLAGKRAIFNVKVHAVEEPQLPAVDATFCATFGLQEGTEEQLRALITTHLQQDVTVRVRAQLRQQLFDGLLAANPIELPNSLVESEIQDMQRNLQQEGSPVAKEAVQEVARRRVALGLLLHSAIKTGGLVADREKVRHRLQEYLQRHADPQQAARDYLHDSQIPQQIENQVLEEQATDWLLERVQLVDQPMSFETLVNASR